LTDDNKEIVIEEASSDKDWENFREKLITATSKNKMVSYCRPLRRSGGGNGSDFTTELTSDALSGQGGQGSPIRCLRL